MEFWKSLSGMLSVEFTSADPDKTLDGIAMAKIQLSHIVQTSELTYRFQVCQKDYRQLSVILKKRGDRHRILRKQGLFWDLKKLSHRPVLLGLFFILLLSSLYLPTQIFFVTVEGNVSVPDRLILSAAEDCGIRFSASRKLVRSEKVKNTLLSAVPQLQWAGVNTSGCTAVISVRERVKEEQPDEENIVSNLVADRDGYILSSTITSGTAHFLPGETVTKGQLLVSGYTDCGICIRADRAEAEILAQTKRRMHAVMPQIHYISDSISERVYEISLLLGKKRINLWKESRISDTGCGRMYEEYYVSLPGGFQLPMAICIDQYFCYQLQEAQVPEAEAQQKLQQFSDNYLLRQMSAGQMIHAQQIFSCSSGLYRLDSNYICTEMIGEEQRADWSYQWEKKLKELSMRNGSKT